MCRLKNKHFVNAFLVLLLLVAPFQGLLAKSLMTHDVSQLTKVTMTMDTVQSQAQSQVQSQIQSDSHADTHEAEHQSNSAESFSNQVSDHSSNHSSKSECQDQCQHCVFCSVAVLSFTSSDDDLISIYNPHINTHSYDITTDVDIRPPRSLPSI